MHGKRVFDYFPQMRRVSGLDYGVPIVPDTHRLNNNTQYLHLRPVILPGSKDKKNKVSRLSVRRVLVYSYTAPSESDYRFNQVG